MPPCGTAALAHQQKELQMSNTNAMPRLNLEILNTRHNKYLAEVRKALGFSNFVRDVDEARKKIRSLQEEYKEWFAERGIELEWDEEK